MEFRQVRRRRVVVGLFLAGPPALYEVRDADRSVVVPSARLASTPGASGRDFQEASTLAARLLEDGDPSWVQWPYGGVLRDDAR